MKKTPTSILNLIVMLSIGSLLSSCTTAPKIEKTKKADIVIAQDSAAAHASFYEMHLGLFATYMYPGVPYLGEHQNGNGQYMWGATEWADGSAVKSLDELADNFDAEDFAATAQSMRAQYIIFTSSHANMNVLFPSEVMKHYLPGHSSHRDVRFD